MAVYGLKPLRECVCQCWCMSLSFSFCTYQSKNKKIHSSNIHTPSSVLLYISKKLSIYSDMRLCIFWGMHKDSLVGWLLLYACGFFYFSFLLSLLLSGTCKPTVVNSSIRSRLHKCNDQLYCYPVEICKSLFHYLCH